MCQGKCSFYGFNPQIQKCRIHKRVFTSGVSNETGWRYYSHDLIPLDCTDLYTDGRYDSGVYDIYPYGTITIPVLVFCHMTTMGGGWAAIQKRVDGSVSFNRSWTEYKNGFGAPEQDYWIGNDVIHLLTKRKNSSLYVSITLQNGTTLYETYDRFSISDETGKYQFFLGGPATGTLGDRMLDTGDSYRDVSGMYFSTPDVDNDRHTGHCAANWYGGGGGGWWYNHCHYAFFNDIWSSSKWSWVWYPPVEKGTEVKETMMM
ncbi:microfibril-associated glycoprotein 4-like, partial [Saccostrea cucullata]|uniref:microfibril-associated glycoprotein 4-like n=1 Tax=Saccostrea cuccullata TaxID=36930 RepID=UPI002ED4B1B9